MTAARETASPIASSPARQVPPVWRAGDAAAAQAFCKGLITDAEALPEILLLLGTPGLDAAALRAMAPALFPAGIGDMFAETLARVYARLAVYGYSFPRWRFLSMGRPALLEAFGMQRLHRATDLRDSKLPDPARDLFGPGFCRRAGSIYIEYRRAYLLISSPAAALMIRNNSYYFGRDRLPAPVLVHWAPGDPAALQALQPDNLADWSKLEDIAEGAPDIPLSEKLMRLESLLAMLDAYDVSLAQWLLDPRGGLAGAAAFLDARLKTGAALPQLAVLPRQAPPWYPAAVTALTPDVLSEMQAMCAGAAPGPRLAPFTAALPKDAMPALLTGAEGDFPA